MLRHLDRITYHTVALAKELAKHLPCRLSPVISESACDANARRVEAVLLLIEQLIVQFHVTEDDAATMGTDQNLE